RIPLRYIEAGISNVASIEKTPQSPASDSLGAKSLNCVGCGFVIQAEFAFCPKCGAPQPARCAGCGYACPPDFAFCPKCGQQQGATPQRIGPPPANPSPPRPPPHPPPRPLRASPTGASSR